MDELEEIRSNIVKLTDDELVQMVRHGLDDYREEALSFARGELTRRGVDVPLEKQSKGRESFSDSEAGRDPSFSWERLRRVPARTWLTIVGILSIGVVAQLVLRSGRLGATGTVIALIVISWSGLLVFKPVLKRWNQNTWPDRARAVLFVVLSIVATVWGLLYFMGLVHFAE